LEELVDSLRRQTQETERGTEQQKEQIKDLKFQLRKVQEDSDVGFKDLSIRYGELKQGIEVFIKEEKEG